MKILILRFSSIGDIVLTTPVIRAVKLQLRAEVHYATKAKFAKILENNPYIDRTYLLKDNIWDLIRDLKRERFDFVIDLHHNLRSLIIKTALSVRSASFDKLNIEKWLLVNLKINRLPAIHIVDRYLAAAATLGVRNDGGGLDYFIPAKDDVAVDVLPATHREEFVAYVLGGLHRTKRLPMNRMVDLCSKIRQPIVLLGGPEDCADAEELIRQFSEAGHSASRLFNGCGQFNLNQSASVMQRSVRVFTHDTGLMHIASALKKEVFSIWGNTVPEFGMYPYRTRHTILENKHISCRPCSKIGYEKCPKGHFNCMNAISFENI